MTTPSEEQPPHWQQPAWMDPAPEQEPTDPRAVEPAAAHAGDLVARPSSPPSVVESTLNVMVAVAWPVAIVLAIMGIGGWVLDLGAAFVISATAGAIAGELRKRRSSQ